VTAEDAAEIVTADAENLGCAVCGELPEAGSEFPCPTCGTVHHHDCWTYNQGCSRYACASGPGWRARPEHDEHAAPTGKVLLSHLSFGSYDGVYYAPWLASAMTIVFELVGLLGPAWGFSWLFPLGMLGMLLCIAWVAVSSERYYLDLDTRAITKAKALFGRDVLEWRVWPLSQVGRLALVPAEPERFVLAAVGRGDDRVLPLAPSLHIRGEHFESARALLLKLKNNNVFPVEIPTQARLGMDQAYLEILEVKDGSEPEGSPG